MRDPNENRPGYKETKVGWIPDAWQPCLLQAACVTSNGIKTGPFGSQLHMADYTEHGTPVVMPVNMKNGRIVDQGIARIAHAKANQLRGQRCREGDVLFARRGELGRCALVTEKNVGWINGTGCLRVRLNTEIAIPDFMMAVFELKHVRHWLQVNAVGQTMLNLNAEILSALPLALPNIPEQQKIAEILSTWDEAIERTRKLIDAKKRRKKGLMQQLLTGKKRLPGFEGEWETQKLGTLFKERRETGREDLPLLAITGSRGVIPADEIDRKDSSSSDKSRYKRIAVGDIGYNTMRMWQGVNALSTLEGIVSPAYTICTPSEALCGTFLSYYFKFQPIVHWFYRYSQGLVSDTWNLKSHNFAQISLPFPEKEEQEAIASVLKAADDEIACHEVELKALEKQKRGLMQKLLTGTVRVKV